MNASQLATRVHLAALPEGEYTFSHPQVGLLNLAYPEVCVGLRLATDPSLEPILQAGWIIIECIPDQAGLRLGLEAVAEAYQARSEASSEEGSTISLQASEVPLIQADPLTLASAPDPERFAVQSSLSPRGDQSHLLLNPPELLISDDLEDILIHYLGTQLLQSVKRAPPNVNAWWPTGSQESRLQDAVTRAHRVLHGLTE